MMPGITGYWYYDDPENNFYQPVGVYSSARSEFLHMKEAIY